MKPMKNIEHCGKPRRQKHKYKVLRWGAQICTGRFRPHGFLKTQSLRHYLMAL
jgi:hypothetical protein